MAVLILGKRMQILLASLALTILFATLLLTTACSATPIAELSLPPSPTPVAPMTELTPAAAEMLAAFLSLETSLPRSEITLQQTEAVTWNDSCLGVSNPEEMCAQVITPGYRVVFSTPRGRFTVHSDRSGRLHRLAQTP